MSEQRSSGGIALPGQPSTAPGLPASFQPLFFHTFNGINTRPGRIACPEQQMYLCDGWMPIAPDDIRILPDVGANILNNNFSASLVEAVTATDQISVATGATCGPGSLGSTWFATPPNVTVSAGGIGLTLNAGGVSLNVGQGFGTNPHTTGKWYFEIAASPTDPTAGYCQFAVDLNNFLIWAAGSAFSMAGFGGLINAGIDTPSGSVGSGDPLGGNNPVSASVGCGAQQNNTTVGAWFNATNQLPFSGNLNQQWFNNNAAHNPATGLGGVSFAGIVGSPYYIALEIWTEGGNASNTVYLKTCSSGVFGPVPAGFFGW